MKQKIQIGLTLVLFFTMVMLSGIGLRETVTRLLAPGISLQEKFDTEILEPEAGSLTPSFIAGPLAADVGELCVFQLNGEMRADWIVVRQIDKGEPTPFYIDTSGSALAFSSPIAAKYTIVASIIEEGRPRILQHVCEYGLTPEPGPEPKPDPTPTPKPEPKTLAEWVRQNVPDAGKSQAPALASCYEAAVQGIEKGAIKTPEAAFSAIRTCSQTKTKIDIWKDFLDKLSEKINERYSGNREIKELGVIFQEIADGLKERPQTPDIRLQENVPEIQLQVKEPQISPRPEARCPEPQCKPQPTLFDRMRGNR